LIPAFGDWPDDVAAITRALQPRVSATPKRNSGIGLFITKMLLDANGGVLLVRSGHGLVESGAVNRRQTSEIALPGTLVVLRARTDRPLNINAVYEKLDDERTD
jgi:signal transduction histidine kinase